VVQVHLHVDCGDEINWIICPFSPSFRTRTNGTSAGGRGRDGNLAVAGNAVNCYSLRIYAMKYITENVANELCFQLHRQQKSNELRNKYP
jgi:uncharacterized membrane protein YfhO